MRRLGRIATIAAITAALVIIAAALASCAPAVEAAPPPPAARPLDVSPVCETVTEISPDDQARLAAAIAALAADNPILAAMGDYKRMREDARACVRATH